MNDKETTIEIATILSNRTKQGMIELYINNEKAQMDIAKAKEVCNMLHEAIEAAISDTIIYKFMKEKVGLPDEKAASALLDFRELRQGSKKTVFIQ